MRSDPEIRQAKYTAVRDALGSHGIRAEILLGDSERDIVEVWAKSEGKRMSPADYLLSFVTDTTGQFLAIHADLRGVEYLIGELQKLRSALLENDCPHTHLFASESPGGELTLTKLRDQPSEVNSVWHVKIYGWDEEWARRHGLKP